ncbi:hypothetical protein BDW02DRAFT_564778 [Decorospora gaudefroyi]|uniref:Uncharacterized protein n=1 Tax=Decorospora gaudefroyi TaxID=184978 RepID=A0A6A5KRA9_9PLEO|nr:hypothetical protein BDW02DRAFT_564778 [Decorospora gaudefroyi]
MAFKFTFYWPSAVFMTPGFAVIDTFASANFGKEPQQPSHEWFVTPRDNPVSHDATSRRHHLCDVISKATSSVTVAVYSKTFIVMSLTSTYDQASIIKKQCVPATSQVKKEPTEYRKLQKEMMFSDTGNRTRALPALYSELTLQMRAANPSH